MAYIPPHKRKSNPNPTPSIYTKTLNKNPNNPSRSKPYNHKNPNSFPSGIVYSPHSICRWYHTSPASAQKLSLIPYNHSSLENNNGANPLTLTVCDNEGLFKDEQTRVLSGIVQKVVRDLEETSRHARGERESGEEGERDGLLVKLAVMVRVGKVLLKGKSESECSDLIRSALTNEGELKKQIHKSFFCTNLLEEYMKNVEECLLQKCGYQIENEKDNYVVIVLDKDQPDLSIPCKCRVSPDGNLELYKAEIKPLRYMVTDISCLHKDFDLRIMLNTKRVLKNFNADVANGIDKLLKAAVINPNVKGGLAWPFGKSLSERFVVANFWHLKYKNLRKEKIRVCLRHVDRFHQQTSTGETSNEVTFKLNGVSELLTEGEIVENTVVDMIQEVVDLIWANFLTCND